MRYRNLGRAKSKAQASVSETSSFSERLYLARRWLFLLLLLVACSGQPSALESLQARGTLRVALDPSYPPFEWVDADGDLVGFDVDLAREIARRIGVEVHFVVTGYDALYDALTVDRADVIISALYPDPTRMAGFVFSPAYFDAGQVLLVSEDAPIASVADLSGKQLMIVFGTEAHMNALEWQKRMDPPPVLLTGDTAETIISAMAAGYADAVVVDNVAAQAALAQSPGMRVVTSVTDEPYVVAATLEDRAIIEAITRVLQAMEHDNTLNTLVDRWMR